MDISKICDFATALRPFKPPRVRLVAGKVKVFITGCFYWDGVGVSVRVRVRVGPGVT